MKKNEERKLLTLGLIKSCLNVLCEFTDILEFPKLYFMAITF